VGQIAQENAGHANGNAEHKLNGVAVSSREGHITPTGNTAKMKCDSKSSTTAADIALVASSPASSAPPIGNGASAASSPHASSSLGTYVEPTTSESWAAVCSSALSLSKAPVSLHAQQNVRTSDNPPAQKSASSVISSKTPAPPASAPSIEELNAFIEASSSWADVASNKVQDKDVDGATMQVSPAFPEEDFSAALPLSPRQASESSSISYAEFAQSTFPKTTRSSDANTEARIEFEEQSNTLGAQSSNATVVQKLDNYYVMSRPERQYLLLGVQFAFVVGSNIIAGISKRMAMAISSVLNEYFVQNPEADEYHVPENYLLPGAVRYLLVKYPEDMSHEFMAYSVPMQDTFLKNVALLRASRKLGMEPYTKHILNTCIGYLKDQLPSYEEIAIIEDHRTSDKDPLWTHMVNHLCHDRYKKLIPDPENFAAFLEEHPLLNEAMAKADIYFAGVAKKNWEDNQAKWQAADDERRARWEQNEKEKREHIAKDQESAASLKKKMDATGGSGLVMATAEEAAFLRNR
jgi:hypothetical protein